MKLYPLDAEQPEALQGEKLRLIKALIDTPRAIKFLQSKPWRDKRECLFRKHNYECLLCKERGQYSRAIILHHVWYKDKHPELALAEFYYSGGKPYMQLMPLCHECHEEMHGHRHTKKREPITPERW